MKNGQAIHNFFVDYIPAKIHQRAGFHRVSGPSAVPRGVPLQQVRMQRVLSAQGAPQGVHVLGQQPPGVGDRRHHLAPHQAAPVDVALGRLLADPGQAGHIGQAAVQGVNLRYATAWIMLHKRRRA